MSDARSASSALTDGNTTRLLSDAESVLLVVSEASVFERQLYRVGVHLPVGPQERRFGVAPVSHSEAREPTRR